MNHKLLIQKASLSAVLLASAIVPGAAYAADPQQPPASVTAPAGVTTVHALPAVAVKPLADPVELAKTYAPDTVEDWQATLDRYKKAAPEHQPPVSITLQTIQPGQADVIQALTGNALPPVHITRIFTEASVTGSMAATTSLEAEISEDVTVIPAIPAVPNGEAPLSLPLQTRSISISKLPDLAQGDVASPAPALVQSPSGNPDDQLQAMPALAISLPLSGIFEAQIELGRAVESKEVKAIQDSLTKLLTAYKEQLAAWEADQ